MDFKGFTTAELLTNDSKMLIFVLAQELAKANEKIEELEKGVQRCKDADFARSL